MWYNSLFCDLLFIFPFIIIFNNFIVISNYGNSELEKHLIGLYYLMFRAIHLECASSLILLAHALL